MTNPDDPTSTKSSSAISSQQIVTHACSSLYIFTWTVLCNLEFQGYPLLSKSARTIFTHANSRLDKFLQALVVIVLVFRVLAIALAFGVLS